MPCFGIAVSVPLEKSFQIAVFGFPGKYDLTLFVCRKLLQHFFVITVHRHFRMGNRMPCLSIQRHHLILFVRQTARQHFETCYIKLAFTISLRTNIRYDTHHVRSKFRSFECKHSVLRLIIFRTKHSVMLFLYQFLRLIKTESSETIQIFCVRPLILSLRSEKPNRMH